jgi:hypothetical protein
MYCTMSLVMLRAVSSPHVPLYYAYYGTTQTLRLMYIACIGITPGDCAYNGAGPERYLPPSMCMLISVVRWDRTATVRAPANKLMPPLKIKK